MSTLKSLVDETTNIKDELVECHSNLKNNLIEKGVECSDTDKMSSLIDKVESLSKITYVAGDTTQLYINETKYIASGGSSSNNVSSGANICSYNVLHNMDSVRVKAYTENYGTYYNMKLVVKIIRNENIVATYDFALGGKDSIKNILNISKDIADIKKNDRIDFYITYTQGNLANFVKNIELCCDIIM